MFIPCGAVSFTDRGNTLMTFSAAYIQYDNSPQTKSHYYFPMELFKYT